MRTGDRSGSRRFSRGPVLGLVAVVLVSGGCVAGLALAPESAPQSLRAAESERVVAVSASDYTDERSLSFTPELEPVRSVIAPRSGVVTSSRCAAGTRITSGDVAFTIDSEPIVALWTSYPLFRDLAPGVRGPDVAAVGQELRRLGYSAPETDSWSAGVATAARSFLKDRGVANPGSTLALDRLLQLDADSVAVSSCPVAVRGRVEAGEELAQAGGGLVRLRAVATDTMVVGDHVVRHADASAVLSPEGVVTDPGFLAHMSSTDEFGAWQATREGGLSLAVSLAEPVSAYTVPPSALYGNIGDRFCVLTADHEPVAVTLLTSSLGNSVITADRALTSVVLAPEDAPPCG